MLKVLSRQTVASVNYDLTLLDTKPADTILLPGAPVIEPRAPANGTYKFIVTFNQTVTGGTAAASWINAPAGSTQPSATCAVNSAGGFDVTVSNVADQELLEVLLTGVTSAATPCKGSGGFRVRILHGDVNQSGAVDATDASQVNAKVTTPPAATSKSNFMFDVNCDGKIDSSDSSACTAWAGDALAPLPLTVQEEACRFLNQATLGVTQSDLNTLVAQINAYLAPPNNYTLANAELAGEGDWLNDQFSAGSTPPSGQPAVTATSVGSLLNASGIAMNGSGSTGVTLNPGIANSLRRDAWFQAVTMGKPSDPSANVYDSLRQRMAFALSEIFVVSDFDSHIQTYPLSAASYQDMLASYAFTNYHDLMSVVTYHPIMGIYLGSIRNVPPTASVHPNENYARELMQLFTIGLYLLNSDGTLQGGVATPTYDQTQITNFARVFTGFTFGNSSGTKPTAFFDDQDYTDTMYLFGRQTTDIARLYHDFGAKTLLSYSGAPWSSLSATDTTTFGDGTTGDAAADAVATTEVRAALNNIFNHPNVPPFVSRLLIQRLVTSNPSPEYINRVASVFVNNGQNVRGDMKSVIKAILLDPEARNTNYVYTPVYSTTYAVNFPFGRLREPITTLTQLARTFAYTPNTTTNGSVLPWQVNNLSPLIGMEELDSPSVFNFYLPDYQPEGPIAIPPVSLGMAADLVAPEFQVKNASTESATVNYFWQAVDSNLCSSLALSSSGATNASSIAMNASQAQDLLPDNLHVIDDLDMRLSGYTLSAGTRATILNALNQLPSSSFTANQRTRAAIDIVINSPEYSIQK